VHDIMLLLLSGSAATVLARNPVMYAIRAAARGATRPSAEHIQLAERYHLGRLPWDPPLRAKVLAVVLATVASVHLWSLVAAYGVYSYVPAVQGMPAWLAYLYVAAGTACMGQLFEFLFTLAPAYRVPRAVAELRADVSS